MKDRSFLYELSAYLIYVKVGEINFIIKMSYCNSVQSTLNLFKSTYISASCFFSLFKPYGLWNVGCHGNQKKDFDFKSGRRLNKMSHFSYFVSTKLFLC